jgi:O-glycosyl hydrolase
LESANTDLADGWNRDLDMDLALYVGRIIHYAMVKGYASSWQWWLALSRGDYKDGLIYLDDGSNNGMGGNLVADYCNNDGYVRQSKLMWGLGNYSLFVRPGMKRVYTCSPDILPDQSYGLLASAYIDAATKKLVIVLVNYSSNAKTIALNMKSGSLDGNLTAYVTSGTSNLKRTKNISAGNVPIQANSITTLVGTYK